MKIAILGLELKPGGGQRLVLEECKFLEAIGHDVILITPTDDKDFRVEVNAGHIKVLTLPSGILLPKSPLNKIYKLAIITKTLKNNKIDLLVSHYHDIDAFLLKRLTGIPYICHINGSRFWFANSCISYVYKNREGFDDIINSIDGHGNFQQKTNCNIFKRVYFKCKEYLRGVALRRAELVTTITNQNKAEIDFCYNVCAKVDYPGVTSEILSLKYNHVDTCLTATCANKLILSVGRLDKRKRNKLLIESFANICESEIDAKLLIVGSGNEMESLQNLADELDVLDNIIFTGDVNEESLYQLYSLADLFVHPAWTAYGLAPLEAYAIGTPIAISTDTMVRELLEGHPGVSIIRPEVSEWSASLSRLLEEPDRNFTNTIVPSWHDYFKKKYHFLQ